MGERGHGPHHALRRRWLVTLADQLPHANVIRYVERMPEEHQVLFATFASSKKAPICSSRPFADWVVRHQHVFGLRG